MSEPAPKTGSIGWIDLTVPDAVAIRNFYMAVVGWTAEPVEMDGYQDFVMQPAGEEQPAAGICHARGSNSTLPPCWLLYVTVANLDTSLERCAERGGTVVTGPRPMGSFGKLAVIRDPAGAHIALLEPAS